MIRLVVLGHARPSVRITARTKWTASARGYLNWQATVAACVLVNPRPVPWKAIGLRTTFFIKGQRRGDLVNLHKAVEDGLQYGRLIENDKAVTRLESRLVSVKTEAEERVEIELWEEQSHAEQMVEPEVCPYCGQRIAGGGECHSGE